MTSPPIVNTIIQKPQQIWYGNSGVAPFFFNNDTVNTLYIGPQRDVLTGNVSNCIPVPPLGGASWPDADWWAFAPAGANLLIIPGATAWAPSPVQVQIALNAAGLATAANQGTQINQIAGGVASALIANPGLTLGQEIAALIASGISTGTPGGTPLLHGYDRILGTFPTVFSVPANSSTFPSDTVSKPGYLIALQATMAAAGATVPFLEVEMEWKDSASGIQLARENWFIPVGSTGNPVNVFGKGPTKGNLVTVGFKNFDPANAIAVTWSMSETTQHIARDDWRSDTPNNVPTFTAALADPFGLILAAEPAVAIGAGANKQWLLPLYAGQAYLFATGTATPYTVTIQAIDSSLSTPLTELYNFIVAAAPGTINGALISLPRCPCLITVANTSAGAGSFFLNITGQEYVS